MACHHMCIILYLVVIQTICTHKLKQNSAKLIAAFTHPNTSPILTPTIITPKYQWAMSDSPHMASCACAYDSSISSSIRPQKKTKKLSRSGKGGSANMSSRNEHMSRRSTPENVLRDLHVHDCKTVSTSCHGIHWWRPLIYII